MKKHQNFPTPFGVLLLIAVLVGVFIFVSKPKPKEAVLPVKPEVAVAPVKTIAEAPKPVIIKEAPKKPVEIVKPAPTPGIIAAKPPVEAPKPKPPPEIVKPKPQVEIVKPKIVAEAPKPKPPVEIAKPKVPEKPKPVEKKVAAQAPKPKPKFSIFQFFKPKPKPVAPVEVALPKPKPPVPEITIPIKGRIAIVIDDFGYNKNDLSIIDQLKYPITTAILPNLPYSKEMANQLHRRGFEIILHLPMQPHGPQAQEKNTIMTSMDDSSIKNILDRDLGAISFAKGVNNHMGSLATEDPRVMGDVFKELNERHLYFLDSYVTPKTVCSSKAREMNIGFAQRDVFLDNQEDPEYIKGQVYKLRDIAREQGYAIGIGHDRKNTLEVLSKVMPELEKEGYKFVTLSELVRK